MDVFCLLPLDFLYLKFGVNPLFRLPRCLKVGLVDSLPMAFSFPLSCPGQPWHLYYPPEHPGEGEVTTEGVTLVSGGIPWPATPYCALSLR